MKPTEIKTFQCPICERTYEDKQEAEDCISLGIPEPIVQVGDIVELNYGFGWFDGDRKWVINPEIYEDPAIIDVCKKNGLLKKNHLDVPGDRTTNCFGPCCTMGFYYVVTKIDVPNDEYHSAHVTRYHVFTKAMSGDKGYKEGYTFEGTHITPIKVKNPPEFVVKNSKDLIGKEARWLL